MLTTAILSRPYSPNYSLTGNPFVHAYAPYITTPQQTRFFRTNLPFSTIAYRKGFKTYRDENDLQLLLTGNIREDLNVGAQFKYFNSIGQYDSQEAKVLDGNAFLSYSGANYAIHGAFDYSILSNFENGGLVDPSSLGGALNAEDLDVNLRHALSSGLCQSFLYVPHRG